MTSNEPALQPKEKTFFSSENALQWAIETLSAHGIEVQTPHEITRDMPWSKVARLFTSTGPLYLKQMAAPFGVEAKLLQFLSRHHIRNVTEVIAYNNNLACFLMKDSGSPMRDHLKRDYQINLVCKTLKTLASIQRACIAQVDGLISMGVPDWRLKNLPNLYKNFITQTDFLKSDGINDSELETLHTLHPYIVSLCDQLHEFGIPETLEHGDFHDNNTLVKDDNAHITINDWGDANVSHPFFSLASWLDSAIWTHHINEDDERYHLIQNAYIEQWQDFGTKEKLLQAFNLAKKLRHFQFALSFGRIKSCPGIEDFKQYYGYIADSLRDFIKSSSF